MNEDLYPQMQGPSDFTLAAIPASVLANTTLPYMDHAVESVALENGQNHSTAQGEEFHERIDDITDTVGAIAIDCLGNVAAGSSSGGIGMKHRGRVGPAALVGVGTAVIPIDPTDVQKLSVGTVTSGTGEHMATTMAANTCANRLYTSTRRGKHGSSESTDDETAIHSFVEKDFMGKPDFTHV